jgi:hypothetical protein
MLPSFVVSRLTPIPGHPDRDWIDRADVHQDKETEQNWAPREKALIRIRGMLRGQAHQQFPEAFVSGLKGGMMEGITKTVCLRYVLLVYHLRSTWMWVC